MNYEEIDKRLQERMEDFNLRYKTHGNRADIFYDRAAQVYVNIRSLLMSIKQGINPEHPEAEKWAFVMDKSVSDLSDLIDDSVDILKTFADDVSLFSDISLEYLREVSKTLDEETEVLDEKIKGEKNGQTDDGSVETAGSSSI